MRRPLDISQNTPRRWLPKRSLHSVPNIACSVIRWARHHTWISILEEGPRANMSWQVPSLYILCALLSIFYVNSKPNPVPAGSQSLVSPSIINPNATNHVELQCFSAVYPARFPVNATDCPIAMMKLVLTPNFNVPFNFSKNTRRLDTVKLPKGWGQGNCIIMVSSANMDTAEFRLADVASHARTIIDVCINGQPVTYGGIVGISDVPSFYVSVAGPANDGSIDILDSLEEYSTRIYDTELGGKNTVSETE